MSIAKALGMTDKEFMAMTGNPIKGKSIGNVDSMIETSELPNEPVIYANNEDDREILQSAIGG